MPEDRRPPVLAHERFRQNADPLSRLSVAERFRFIYEHNLWGADTSVSGLGSEMKATDAIRSALPRLLRDLDVATLLDAPCGDAGWISRVDLGGVRYVGLDIVPDIVSRNRSLYPALGEFAVADLIRDDLPRSNAILCRDCLVHLSFAHIDAALGNFLRSGARWLMTTTFTQWRRNADCDDGDWRALNFEAAPFAWGPPVAIVNEDCDEGGGGWRDKSLAVWDLASIAGARGRDRPGPILGASAG
ncbi:class I SAM-dependent methyltransferase [Methylobacterium nonmethylotrophicum]|uniref:class I SAM-dependent methyltransferase n=1 Tax=Methylobacterium nonmethylotrophicum TaxID=1141884 RepID=UPI001FE16B25|nr:class I SAM-dependent methyltransferase [Methylobacterium nonmethylotrophicum]